MARRRLEPGELGEISYETVTRADGRTMVKARSRYRDAGGVTKRLSAEGTPKAAAKNSLKIKHKDLLSSGVALGAVALTVAHVVETYMAGLQLQDLDNKARGARHATQGTLRQYQRLAVITVQVLGNVCLGDLTVQHAQQLEALVDPVSLKGAAAAKQARNLLARAIDDAQRLGQITGNPIQAASGSTTNSCSPREVMHARRCSGSKTAVQLASSSPSVKRLLKNSAMDRSLVHAEHPE